MALEEHSILIKALVTAELWPLFSGRSPEALPTGSAHEGLAPFIWCNSERSETLENGDLRRPPDGNHVFTEAVLEWLPPLLLE